MVEESGGQQKVQENENVEGEEVSQEQLLWDAKIVSKLEDFCSSGEFTSYIADFQMSHCHKFTDSEDQPIMCYELFKEYSKTIDSKLDIFLSEVEISSEQMYESLWRMEQVSPGFLFCLDILMAAVDYSDFVQFMLSFQQTNFVEDYPTNMGKSEEPKGEEKKE